MKRQVGSSCSKKINFIKENKKNLALLSKKNQKQARNRRSLSLSPPQVRVIPIKKEILKKKLIPKSQMPGFDFKLSLQDINHINTPLTYWISNEKSLYPKDCYSDTDCPPSPPKDILEVIEESSYETNKENFESPNNKNAIDQGTQVENSYIIDSGIYLRRSERLAKKKELKRKLLNTDFKCKRIKYN
ncbi:hypothetical protein SteCoe_14638 [Stentor coeruleus]|uniref:Uncharacterized protein n=1 Tax=Stentor coeruleus TaxID=5963 RepID=A0A1R2C5N8_9CILI|nr:hypothetical protein SteCoe_14638 [Stentor coeruleus]